MKDFLNLKDEADQQFASKTFKDKVEWIANELKANWNWISVSTLYDIFFENYGWDRAKIRYAIKLLVQWGVLVDAGWANTLAVNKSWGTGKTTIYCRDDPNLCFKKREKGWIVLHIVRR